MAADVLKPCLGLGHRNRWLSFPPNRAPDWYGSPKPQSEVNRLCRSANWDGMLVDQAPATPATILDRSFQLVIVAPVCLDNRPIDG